MRDWREAALRLRRHWIEAVALLAVLPQLVAYAGHVRRGDYPGSAYAPRVEAMIEVSAVAAQGGPFATTGGPERHKAVEWVQTDLGVPALADGLGRVTGRPITVRTLGAINLVVLAAAAIGLVFILPRPYRLGLAAVFLLVPLSLREYTSADIPTLHGAFAALAFVIAIATARGGPPWVGVPLGVGLLLLHKLRAVYGVYSLAAALVGVVAGFVLRRDRRLVFRAGVLLMTLLALEAGWRLGLQARAHDPRMAERDALGTHDVFKPLISGIGWTENRWGIKPWDPWVAQYVADRVGQDPVPIYTVEGERRSRLVYLSLWREAPGHLVSLYLGRIPAVLRDWFFLGWLGAAAWMLAVAAALGLGRPDAGDVQLLLVSVVLVGCLVAQSVTLDPRPLYAQPLRFLSALSLSVAVTAALRARRRPVAPLPAAGSENR